MTAPNEARMVPYVDDNGTLRVGLKSVFDPDVAPGASTTITQTTTITTAQLRTLFASPVPVVDAPPAEYVIDLIRWRIKCLPVGGTGTFRSGDPAEVLALKYDDGDEANGGNATVCAAFQSGITIAEWVASVPIAFFDLQLFTIASGHIRQIELDRMIGNGLVLTMVGDELLAVGGGTSFTPISGGTGYAEGDRVHLNPPLTNVGSSAVLIVEAVDGGGAIVSISINDPGDGYAVSGDTFTVASTDGGGTGASFSVDSITGPSDDNVYEFAVDYQLVFVGVL